MLDALTAMSPNASATVCASRRRSGSMGVSSKLATTSASPGSVALIATPLRLYATTSKVADRQLSLTRTRILFHSSSVGVRAGSAHRAGVQGFASSGRPGRRLYVSTCRAAHWVVKILLAFTKVSLRKCLYETHTYAHAVSFNTNTGSNSAVAPVVASVVLTFTQQNTRRGSTRTRRGSTRTSRHITS